MRNGNINIYSVKCQTAWTKIQTSVSACTREIDILWSTHRESFGSLWFYRGDETWSCLYQWISPITMLMRTLCGHLRFVSSSPIEQGRVTHRPLGIRSLLTSVLPKGRLPLVVGLQLQEAGRGVVAAVESCGGRDLPLGPGGGAAVPTATPITSSRSQQISIKTIRCCFWVSFSLVESSS